MFSTSKQLMRITLNYCSSQRIRLVSNKKAEVAQSGEVLIISDTCVQRLKQLCDNNETFLRLCVESGGCSGFQYKFNLDNKMTEEDRIFEKDGVKVVVDDTSLEYIKGSTIDYHTELIRSAFRVVQNPNVDLGCSCGASFSIKID